MWLRSSARSRCSRSPSLRGRRSDTSCTGAGALSDNRLAPGWRAGSGFAAVVLAVFAWVMLARSGAVSTGWSDSSVTFGSWLVVGYMALNTLGNLMAVHPVERWVFSAMTASVVIVGAVVAGMGPG